MTCFCRMRVRQVPIYIEHIVHAMEKVFHAKRSVGIDLDERPSGVSYDEGAGRLFTSRADSGIGAQNDVKKCRSLFSRLIKKKGQKKTEKEGQILQTPSDQF